MVKAAGTAYLSSSHADSNSNCTGTLRASDGFGATMLRFAAGTANDVQRGALADGRVAMENALWMFGALTAAASVFVLIDWFGRRKDRRSRNRAA